MKDEIIIKPIITEKSMDQASKGKFTFMVAKEANKNEVIKALEKRFKVNAVGISTCLVKGKTTKVGKRRAEVVKSSWKKAIITLKPGEKIELFEVAQSK